MCLILDVERLEREWKVVFLTLCRFIAEGQMALFFFFFSNHRGLSGVSCQLSAGSMLIL